MTESRPTLSRWRRASWGALGGVVAGAVMCVVAPNALIPSAYAAPGCFQDPGNDADDDYGSMSLVEQTNGTQTQGTLSGIRASNLVGSAAVPCGRINSVFVASPNFNRLMEFGWAKGWLSCYGGTGSYTDYANNVPFAVGYFPGSEKCRIFSNNYLTPGDFQHFRSSDTDENGYWGGWLDGTALQPDGWALGFTQGMGGINAERQNVSDPGFANWPLIQEHIGGSWSNTDDLGDQYDTDPDFYFNYVNQHNVKFSEN